MVSSIVLGAAETMSEPRPHQPAVEALQSAAIDLPAFSTLDRLVNRLRAKFHGQITIASRDVLRLTTPPCWTPC